MTEDDALGAIAATAFVSAVTCAVRQSNSSHVGAVPAMIGDDSDSDSDE